jgi:cadmium resistance protein CadD (predicted permease)
MQIISAAITAFIVTNIDDLAILLLLFAKERKIGRLPLESRRSIARIVIGQYLGFTVLVAASLPGIFTRAVVPVQVLGWLGLIPLGLGIKGLWAGNDGETAIEDIGMVATSRSIWRDPYTYAVAGITIGNGGDNIAVYLSYFANQTSFSLWISLLVFYGMMALWCAIAYRLNHIPRVHTIIAHWSDRFVPWVFICLGLYIIYSSNAWSFF